MELYHLTKIGISTGYFGTAPYLQFRTVGKVTGEVILSVLFAAAARISSIHETCGRLAKAPCEETFTAALYPQLVDVERIQRGVNAAFASGLAVG